MFREFTKLDVDLNPVGYGSWFRIRVRRKRACRLESVTGSDLMTSNLIIFIANVYLKIIQLVADYIHTSLEKLRNA